MLAVTEPARARLVEMLAGSGFDSAIRICEQNGRLRLRRDVARTGDTTYDTRGRTVLVLDNQMTEALSRRTLDIRETDNGPRLRLKRPTGPN